MAQYISKAAVVAEIEKRRKEWRYGSSTEAKFKREECDDILSIIDTLEVKEVDFNTFGVLAEHLLTCYAHGVSPKYNERELDMLEKMENNKAQKGE